MAALVWSKLPPLYWLCKVLNKMPHIVWLNMPLWLYISFVSLLGGSFGVMCNMLHHNQSFMVGVVLTLSEIKMSFSFGQTNIAVKSETILYTATVVDSVRPYMPFDLILDSANIEVAVSYRKSHNYRHWGYYAGKISGFGQPYSIRTHPRMLLLCTYLTLFIFREVFQVCLHIIVCSPHSSLQTSYTYL